MDRFRTLALISAAAVIASCGRVAELKPAAGDSLPVRPAMASATPTPEQLLTPPAYARPERVDELLKRSEPRKGDPFDLPPPTGGVAPAAPAGAVSAVTNGADSEPRVTEPK